MDPLGGFAMIQLGAISPNVDRKFRRPRMWSNRELNRFSCLFKGDVVNVSAGDDVDKEGHCYRDYFLNCNSYTTTNYGPGLHRGFQGRDDERLLDLCQPLPVELVRQFDTVFNHTTLEHVVNVGQAMENLCRLSRDVVILVVPFLQAQHETTGYRDYWRFTPTLLRHLFAEQGFDVIYESANDERGSSVYIFQIASCHSGKWESLIPRQLLDQPVGDWLGQSSSTRGGLRRLLSFWDRRKSA